jgi:type II secretory pathway component PulF
MNRAYFYKAHGSSGEVTGVVYAERRAFARSALRKMGLTPKVVRFDPLQSVLGGMSKGFDDAALEQFYRYFSRLEAKGAPRAAALSDAVGTTSDLRLKGALASMSEAIGGRGMKVSEAMSAAGFPERDCNMVANIEDKRSIDTVLSSLADELKRMQDIKRSISKMLLMPKIVLFAAIVLFYMNIVFFSPKFHNLFKNVMTTVELPTYAKAYYEACDVFNQNLIVGSIGYVALILGGVMVFRSDAMKRTFEVLKPVRIAREKADYAALWGSFSLLYDVGVHREEICRGLSKAAATKEARACFARMSQLVREGIQIDDAVVQSRFPLYIVNPVSAAHRSGSLVDGTKELCEKLIVDLDLFSNKATTWINVAITLLLAGVVVLFAMLTIIPMMSSIFSAV